jgi:hypothetical protein
VKRSSVYAPHSAAMVLMLMWRPLSQHSHSTQILGSLPSTTVTLPASLTPAPSSRARMKC